MDKRAVVVLESNNLVAEVCGANDENLKELERLFGLRVLSRGNEVHLESNDPTVRELFSSVLRELESMARRGQNPGPAVIRSLYRSLVTQEDSSVELLKSKTISVPGGFGNVYPKGAAQAAFIEGLDNYDMSFCVGPAGTGKTFLAVAHALSQVLSKQRRKLILTRPVVEAGESLGYLPGDLSQKISPYLRPLYDAMESLIPADIIARMDENRMIEVAPLAYMRGRSLRDCYIILDEAQNTTREQMKMFLTRLGEGSVAVITGDITQIDLPKAYQSGLIHALEILRGIDEIHMSYFASRDVVRSPLVRKIVSAYESQ
ncbi:MAG: PhoH family protein [Spirochaetales bacterium]